MQPKKLFLSSAVLFVSVTLLLVGFVGASSEMWTQTYGGTADDYAEAMVQTSDGGYALAGYTTSFGAGSYDFWLVKTDEYGNVEWNQTYGGEDIDHAYALVETSDGGYVIAGGSLLVKTDMYGNMEWNQTYGGVSLVETSSGGYVIAGTKNDDFSLVKIDTSGKMEWNRTYGGPEVERAYSLVETSDGGFALAGEKIVNFDCDGVPIPAWRFWLVKTDEMGNMLWNHTYGNLNSVARSLVRTSDGGYALAGTMSSFNPAIGIIGGPLLVKTDEYGNMEWNQTFSGWQAFAVVEASDGGYAIAGAGSMVKTDKYGNMEWNQTVGGVVNSLLATSDGGYALAGALNGDFWLAKADEHGVIPEFPSLIILPLFLVGTLVAIILKKKT
ncbi:hypothetical protein JW988_05380 [Candidatus Bathyarchaeota archaeon]|nr:hypothetical protein [Candidatus Bathyarchaeota archaeon]